MNNTSRFKFYGILTALILVAVGVVWFYPRKEHSSKVPHAKRDGVAQQVNRPPQQRPPQQPVTSSTQQSEIDALQKSEDDAQKILARLSGTTFQKTFAHATGMDIPIAERPKIKLTPDQEKQVEVALNAIKNDVMQMLAGNASYQQTDDCTIVINTRLSQEQSDEIDKRFNKEVGDIIGDENVQKLDGVLINGLRMASYAWGTGVMQFTVTGADRYTMGTFKPTELPLKTAEAFAVKSHYNLVGGISSGMTYLCSSKDAFIKEYGALAIATLQMATGEGN